MSNNNLDLHSADVLESWLDGSLSPSQRAAVEQRIATDPAYASEVKRLRGLDAGLKLVGRSAQGGGTMRPAAEAQARAAMHTAREGKAPARASSGLRLVAPLFAALLIVMLGVLFWPSLRDAVVSQPQATPVSAPLADFRWEQMKPDRFSVQFTNLSVNASDQTWQFGDGQQSNAPNPLHVYAQAGDYTVTLNVRNSQFNATRVEVVHLR